MLFRSLIEIALVGQNLVQMVAARRRRSAGSRLHLRLTGVFAVMALLPTITVAVFATLSVNMGLEAWFSDRVGRVVDNSVLAAQAYEDEQRRDLVTDAEVLASLINATYRAAVFLDDGELRQLLTRGQRSIQRGLRGAFVIDGTGEIVISGPNVTSGYESNPEANAKNFFDAEGARWFRTGDQGKFDDDGYLILTGRLKEIINRGGEKVSPLEVDGVLSAHDAVAQVVNFALPHPKLGEEVAAAVVLQEGSAVTDKDIRAFAADRMADFKVPRKVIILDEIPKGATGKMQRIGMAEKLGLVEPA